MSIATEISRIQTARNTIRSKAVELGIGTGTDQLDVLATKIGAIENSPGPYLQRFRKEIHIQSPKDTIMGQEQFPGLLEAEIIIFRASR